MIVICEECGQKYELDPAIMTRRKAKFKCKSCNYMMTILKHGESAESVKDVEPDDLIHPAEKEMSIEELSYPSGGGASSTPFQSEKEIRARAADFSRGRGIGIGLRLKLMLFFLLPLILALAVAGFFFVKQMEALGNAMTDESLRMLTSVSENEVLEYSKAVAQQIQIYLALHPELKKENFNNDADLKKLAVQRITLTMRGNTSLYEPTADGKQIFWAHANPNYVGREAALLQTLVGNKGFNDFLKIIRQGQGGKENSGYYTQYAETPVKDVFMACTPVKGTPYYVACTTSLSESTNVMDVPMSPLFQLYLDMEAWRSLENEWWKKK